MSDVAEWGDASSAVAEWRDAARDVRAVADVVIVFVGRGERECLSSVMRT